MSPQVSQPRRRLPTGVNPRAGRLFAQVGDQLRRDRRRCRTAGGGRRSCCALLDRLEDQRFLLRAHALERAQPARLRRRRQLVEAADVQRASRAARRSSARRPAGAAGRGCVGGNSCEQLLVDSGTSPVSASSRIFVGEVLADARQLAQLLRRPCGATASARAAMVSAAERYARILKGFSPLISSRSAISREHLRDRLVIHASGRRARCGSRAAARRRRASASAIASRASGGP